MKSNRRKWKLERALEYANDRSLRSRDKLSRIFIEPPVDEPTSICEDSDDDVSQLNLDCEVVLRSGKRLKIDRTQSPSKKWNVNSFAKSAQDIIQPPQSSKQQEEVNKCVTENSSVKMRNESKDKPKQCQKRKLSTKIRANGVQETTCDKPKQCQKRKLPTKIRTNDHEETICDKKFCDIEPENGTKKKLSSESATNDFIWIDDVSKPMEPIFPVANYTDCNGLSAYEQFEKFFDDELLQLIAKESSKYAAHLEKPDPKITVAELKVYIAILIISGYSIQSRFESYWSKDADLRNELICSSMRKNRFKQITQFLHFEDINKPNFSDKIWKLRPLTDHLKTKILKNFHAEQNLSYDESMIEYYGRHSMKQYLKDKPVPFGFKVWSLCTPSGYMANFEIYQGKNPRSKTLYEERYGKCIAPLFNMIDDFEEHIRALPFSFYFDNLFTGVPALLQLKALGYNGTGTIRENRIPNGCPLKQNKKAKNETKKLGRGFMTGKSVDGLDIHVTKWVDNSVVCVASTVYGMKPITKALRYSSDEQKKVEVPRPLVVAKYNQHMGGVDRMDQNISLYRIGIHGKKWWSCIFTWMIDVAIQNAWQLHRVSHPEMPQLDFRREITLFYCGHYGVPPKSTGNRLSKISEEDSKSTRYDNQSHWPRSIPNRRRCAKETCKGTPKTICAKCNLGLCIKCFESYHSLEKFRQ